MKKRLFLIPLISTYLQQASERPKISTALVALAERLRERNVLIRWQRISYKEQIIYQVSSEQLDLYDAKKDLHEIVPFIPVKKEMPQFANASRDEAIREAFNFTDELLEINAPQVLNEFQRGNHRRGEKKDKSASRHVSDQMQNLIKAQVNDFRGDRREYAVFKYRDSYQGAIHKRKNIYNEAAEICLELQAKSNAEIERQNLLAYQHAKLCSIFSEGLKDESLLPLHKQGHIYAEKKDLYGCANLYFAHKDGLHWRKHSLIIPMYDVRGVLRTCQHIANTDDARKLFLAKHSTKGVFFPVNYPSELASLYNCPNIEALIRYHSTGKLILVEGVATAWSLYKLLDYPQDITILACMSIGGIESLVKELDGIKRPIDLPPIKIFISPDNDFYKADNVGKKKGKQLASAYPWVKLALPDFDFIEGENIKASDWDDLLTLHCDGVARLDEIEKQLKQFYG